MTLLATRARRLQALAQGIAPENAPGISCKRKEILRLTLDDYKALADPVTRGFEKASKSLFGLKIFRVPRLALSHTSHPNGCDLGRPGRRGRY